MLSNNESSTPIVEILKSIISLIVTCIGLAVILIGLKYAMDIFQLVFSFVQSPANMTDPIRQMADSIGGDVFDLNFKDRSVPLANIMALTVYCGGILLIAWLTLAMMHTGAKIVSLTAGDRNAVKKLLHNAFGNRMQPKSTDGKNVVRSHNES